MATKVPAILSLSAALASLQGLSAANATPAAADLPGLGEVNTTESVLIAKGKPNIFMSIGHDLLGLIVTTKADGTVVADHYSHYSHSSHASHSSHSSHYSGR